MKDPIVEEVRKHRMEHTRKHAGDLSAILADLREVQERSGHKIVRLPPRKIEQTSHSSRPRKLGP
jgi:hypothetical protein